MFGKVGRRKPESVTSLRSPPLSASLSIDVHLQRENPGGYCLWRHAWSDLTPRVASSKGGDGAVGWQRGLPGFSRGAALGKTPHHSGILLCGSLSHQHPSPPLTNPPVGKLLPPLHSTCFWWSCQAEGPALLSVTGARAAYGRQSFAD